MQFSAVTHYLCDPTQTPNSRSRVAALCHIYNLSAVSIAVKVDELQSLVEKLLGGSKFLFLEIICDEGNFEITTRAVS